MGDWAMARILLTLDDVPVSNVVYHPDGTGRAILRQLLHTIQESQVRAVLFVVTSRLTPGYCQDIREAMAASPSSIVLGNHTHSHISFKEMGLRAYSRDVARCTRELARLFGEIRPALFRPPFLELGQGTERSRCLDCLSKSGLRVLWPTASFADWALDTEYLENLELGSQPSVLRKIEEAYETKARRTIEGCGNDGGMDILMLHCNALTARFLPVLLSSYRNRFL
jgi:peptidoglycan/xylan/chitin deacetylase (PgdA/CDA1 family)